MAKDAVFTTWSSNVVLLDHNALAPVKWCAVRLCCGNMLGELGASWRRERTFHLQGTKDTLGFGEGLVGLGSSHAWSGMLT